MFKAGLAHMTASLEHVHKCSCQLTGVLLPCQAMCPFRDPVNMGLGSQGCDLLIKSNTGFCSSEHSGKYLTP